MATLTRNDTNAPESLVYEIEDIARMLGIGSRTIYHAISRNEFPHKKIGRRIIIPRKLFDRWLEEGNTL